jgi:hypothetical protein
LSLFDAVEWICRVLILWRVQPRRASLIGACTDAGYAMQEFVYRCGGLKSGASTCYPYASFPGSCPAYTTLITRGPS